MHWIYYLLLLVILIAGLALNILSLPGLWVMLAGVFVYAWITGWAYVGVWTLLTLLILALLAELFEFLAGSAGAKQAGGSKRAMVGAIVGGLAGAVFLSIPLPIIGTIIGVCLGSFIGAAIVELAVKRDPVHSLFVGLGAAKGRFQGILIKLGFGVAMLVVSLWMALPLPLPLPLPLSRRPASPPPAVDPLPPATTPATTSAVQLPPMEQ